MLEVQKLSKKHNFLIMEDRKFGDVGHTIYNQISGFFNYKEWADLVKERTTFFE